MPFQLSEIVSLTSFLKDISLGLVELAFPEVRSSVNEHYRSMLRLGGTPSSYTGNPQSTDNSQMMRVMWPHLMKVCVSLLRQLHTRDLRRGFCPEHHWTVQGLNLPLDKPTDLQIPRGRRGPRPFQPIKDFTREDFGGFFILGDFPGELSIISDLIVDSSGPPLSTKQIRSITILREIPFVVPFNTRVGIFQGLLAADRLR